MFSFIHATLLDFEIYNACVGPGDDLTFSYRIAISPISASRGVRIKCVKFIFKENHLIGDIRGTHVRATKELMRWEHHYENNGNKKKRRKQQQTITSLPVHHPTLSRNSSSSASALLTGNTSSHQQGTSSHNAANNDIPPNTTTRTTSPATPPRLIESKSAILSHRSNAMTRNTSSDFSNIDTSGLYAEAEASLRLPLTTTNSNNNNSVVVAPSIPRPSSDPVPMFPGQPAAVIEIKHVLRVDIGKRKKP